MIGKNLNFFLERASNIYFLRRKIFFTQAHAEHVHVDTLAAHNPFTHADAVHAHAVYCVSLNSEYSNVPTVGTGPILACSGSM